MSASAAPALIMKMVVIMPSDFCKHNCVQCDQADGPTGPVTVTEKDVVVRHSVLPGCHPKAWEHAFESGKPSSNDAWQTLHRKAEVHFNKESVSV